MSTIITPIPSKEFLQEWFFNKLAEVLDITVDQVDMSKSFMDYGLSSLAMVGIEGDLEDLLKVELDPTLLWDYPSIELIVDFLAEPRQ